MEDRTDQALRLLKRPTILLEISPSGLNALRKQTSTSCTCGKLGRMLRPRSRRNPLIKRLMPPASEMMRLKSRRTGGGKRRRAYTVCQRFDG